MLCEDYLGMWRAGGPLYYIGDMYDMRVYNMTLTASQIYSIYNHFGNDNICENLAARYLLNEATTGTAAAGANSCLDISKNANHGTPNGNPNYIELKLRLGRKKL